MIWRVIQAINSKSKRFSIFDEAKPVVSIVTRVAMTLDEVQALLRTETCKVKTTTREAKLPKAKLPKAKAPLKFKAPRRSPKAKTTPAKKTK